jgi:hypothetical protein
LVLQETHFFLKVSLIITNFVDSIHQSFDDAQFGALWVVRPPMQVSKGVVRFPVYLGRDGAIWFSDKQHVRLLPKPAETTQLNGTSIC